MTARDDWRDVTTDDPCPVCGCADWCRRAADGQAVWCARGDEAPHGWRKSPRPSKEGTVYFLASARKQERRRTVSPEPRPEAQEDGVAVDYAAEAHRLAAACNDERVRTLAQGLGVRIDTLRALGLGWADGAALQILQAGGSGWRDDYPPGAYAIPERDSKGRVVGLALRAPDGRKGFPRGAARGLIVPDGLDAIPGPLLVVEGASDVAAALTLGIAAIGRPSNRGGATQVSELLRGRDALIVGERDEDPARPDRGWPGRDGAVHVAGLLAREWHQPVRWTLPPDGTKDVRAWLLARASAGLSLDDLDECHAAGAELLAMLLAADQFEDPPLSVRLVPENYGRHIATLVIAAPGDRVDTAEVIHTGRLRIAEAVDRSEWAAEAVEGAARHAPWLGDGDAAERERLIGELLDAAVREAMAKLTGGGDAEDEERATVSERIVRLAEDRFRFGVSEEGEAFAVVREGPNIALSLRGSAEALRARLARDYRRLYGTTPSGSALTDALTVISGEAQDCPPEPVALRIARHGSRIVLDLGDATGHAVVLDASGWQVVDHSPVLFRRTALTGEMPTPQHGGSIDELWSHIAVAPPDRPLLVGWLAHALIPDEPHAILLLGGPQGAGKTTTAERLAMVIDASGAPTRAPPRESRQWAISAAGSHVVAIDNVSHLNEWFSDALCRAATGDGWIDRALYTDSTLAVLRFQRAIMLTSIDPGALRGDLADRLVLADLERITVDERRSMRELNAAFQDARPRLLGAVLDLTVEVLRRRDAHMSRPLPRMADFGTVLAALDEARGTDGLARYIAQGRRVAEDVIEADLVAAAVAKWAQSQGAWSGTAAELLAGIEPESVPRGWPATPRALAGKLRRAAPALAELGVIIEPPPPNARPRLWRVTVSRTEPPDGPPPDGPDGPDAHGSPDGPANPSLRGDSDGSDGPDGRTRALEPRDEITVRTGAQDGDEAASQQCAGGAETRFEVPLQGPPPTVGTVGPSRTGRFDPLEAVSTPTVGPSVRRSTVAPGRLPGMYPPLSPRSTPDRAQPSAAAAPPAVTGWDQEADDGGDSPSKQQVIELAEAALEQCIRSGKEAGADAAEQSLARLVGPDEAAVCAEDIRCEARRESDAR